jgi:hypothetical protein
MSARRLFARPARFAAIAPYLWMVLFFLVPFGFVLKISLSQTVIARPPYVPLFDLTQGFAAFKAALAALSADNFRLMVSDDLYVLSYLRLDVDPPRDRLSHCLWHGATSQALAGRGDDAGDRAVLDLVFDPHLRLDQYPAA